MVNSPKLFFILLDVNHFVGVGKGLKSFNEESYAEVNNLFSNGFINSEWRRTEVFSISLLF